MVSSSTGSATVVNQPLSLFLELTLAVGEARMISSSIGGPGEVVPSVVSAEKRPYAHFITKTVRGRTLSPAAPAAQARGTARALRARRAAAACGAAGGGASAGRRRTMMSVGRRCAAVGWSV